MINIFSKNPNVKLLYLNAESTVVRLKNKFN